MGNERARIYVMTHKEFIVPDDPMYVSVHVGRKPWLDAQEKAVDSGRRDGCQALLTYTGDASGDNISDCPGCGRMCGIWNMWGPAMIGDSCCIRVARLRSRGLWMYFPIMM